MIKEKNNELVLQPNLLKLGETYERFAKVDTIETRMTVNHRRFLRIILRGESGTYLVGRIFNDALIDKFIDAQCENKVILVSFYLEEVYGEKSASIDWFVVPSEEDEKFKGISVDLFESCIEDIDACVTSLKDIFNKYKTCFTVVGNNLMTRSLFTSLWYVSDYRVCSGKSGYLYLILSECWKRLEFYHSVGYLTSTDVGFGMLAQMVTESILASINTRDSSYNMKVFSKINTFCTGFKDAGLPSELEALNAIITDYANKRIGFESKFYESKVATVLFNEYNAILNNLMFLPDFSIKVDKGGKHIK